MDTLEHGSDNAEHAAPQATHRSRPPAPWGAREARRGRATFLSACALAACFTVLPLGCADERDDGGLAARVGSWRCGDGDKTPDEKCDDGNEIDGDGCTKCRTDDGFTCQGTVCTSTCGDRITASDEACDDPANPSYCNKDCQVVGSCGDGVVQAVEACDWKLTSGCAGTCRPARGFRCDPKAGTCEPDSDLPRDADMSKLTAEQETLFCDWLTGALGGEGTVNRCDGIDYRTKPIVECVAALTPEIFRGCTFDEVATWSLGQEVCGLLGNTPPCVD